MPLRLLLLALPLAEIGVFIMVGRQIGVVATLLLTLGTTLLGAALLRRQGVAAIQRIRAELAAGRLPAQRLAEGAMIALAGFLLVVPGFLTDAVGLALFVPAARLALWRFGVRRFAALRRHFPTAPRRGGPVIELERGDFASQPAPPDSRPADRDPGHGR